MCIIQSLTRILSFNKSLLPVSHSLASARVYSLVHAQPYESTTPVVDSYYPLVTCINSLNKSYHSVSRSLSICHIVYGLVVAQCNYYVI